jgi:hypothetical protein
MKFFYAFLFLLLAVVCGAQTKERELPCWSGPYPFRLENEKATLILTRVGQAAGFSFSYNSSIIDANHIGKFECAKPNGAPGAERNVSGNT